MELVVGSFLAGNKIVKCLYNRNTKGAVYSAYENQSMEEKDNLAACRILADQLGWTCVLLPPVPNKKTADILRADDLTLWEIKTNSTGTVSSIDNELRAAKSQSQNVIIRFTKEHLATKKLEQAALKRAHRSGIQKLIFIAGVKAKFVKV